MSTADPDATDPGVCSSCRGPLTGSSVTGILCLRCAGLRVLSLDSGEEAPALGFARRIGPYEIIEELGRGGMGRVYAARQIGLGRIVALKAITAGLATPAELEMRFLREAQTIARLHHPNIVAVHDSGRADGYLYFSMDYVEGGDAVVVVGGTREIVMLTELPIFTWTPAAGC